MSDQTTAGEVALDALGDRERYRSSLARLVTAVRNSYLGDVDADLFDALAEAEHLVPDATPGTPVEIPNADWGEMLTIPPDELLPYDRIADGRFVESLHGSVTGRWTRMRVGSVSARVEVARDIAGTTSTCFWGPEWGPLEDIPVPAELTVFRGGRLPDYTCTAPGNSDACGTCPARSDG